ncbi:extracellular serine/threonine protein kinase FAM20C-like [Lingula anatina]|uniref:Extracellular serine/threonine protein kinase FAM20C-like n=1 Tax=Lingula anatina TaxID=7574 RepID=A0A2R2MMV5_LINAN|nr:extracellular serine/threonine protein kinase FAM20C-like [Lingula anatina]|eukprot:XP_023931535.1 extracellular serine/threonine protein kinase FAM20C-like [Lingula anatina]
MTGGTQLKLLVTFSSGEKAALKPMRQPRDYETPADLFYFNDYERHNAEIAAFHLSRLLGFHWAPPVAGRRLNITAEVLLRTKNAELIQTFFSSPAGNMCFHGECAMYCDSAHAVCGRPDVIEASLAAMLPPLHVAPRHTWLHPWRRTYSKHQTKAVWEVYDKYCQFITKVFPYSQVQRLLDLVDMAVLDFLIGNMDRHHYETFANFGTDSFPLLIDQAKGFGKSTHDEMTILAPLYQCCIIRETTHLRLIALERDELELGSKLKFSMRRDTLDPVLTEQHLHAVNRRLRKVIAVVGQCILETNTQSVVINGN